MISYEKDEIIEDKLSFFNYSNIKTRPLHILYNLLLFLNQSSNAAFINVVRMA